MQFPLNPIQLTGLSDTNWGPQDQSVPKEIVKLVLLDLFKTWSIAGYVVWLGGPVNWSKRQTYTARSSAQAEFGAAVDECNKSIYHIINTLKDLSLFGNYYHSTCPITIYNDNSACVQLSHNIMTTKGSRYIQIHKISLYLVQACTIQVEHVGGKNNCSHIFTKEGRDIMHFPKCLDSLWSAPVVVLGKER